jgi:hypothetical protein
MSPAALPLWLDLLVSALVLAGALVALIGSFGLLRLASYFERVHAPSIIATLACWCVMHASLIYFSAIGDLALHALLRAHHHHHRRRRGGRRRHEVHGSAGRDLHPGNARAAGLTFHWPHGTPGVALLF